MAGSNEADLVSLRDSKTKLLLPKAVVREAGPNCEWEAGTDGLWGGTEDVPRSMATPGGRGCSPVNGHSWVWPLLFALDLCSLLGVKALGVKGIQDDSHTTAQVVPRLCETSGSDLLSEPLVSCPK